MRLLLVFFIGVPLLEMVILIQVGGLIGALPTVALVVLTATIGLWLLRLEGLATLAKVQEKMAHGELPGIELLEGAMLLVGGALLLTPGFVTDTIGFVCLIPVLRQPLIHWFIRRGLLKQTGFAQGPHASQPTIIEGEYEEQSPHAATPNDKLRSDHDDQTKP